MLALKMSTKNVLKEKVMPWEKRNIFKRYAMARRDSPERVRVSGFPFLQLSISGET